MGLLLAACLALLSALAYLLWTNKIARGVCTCSARMDGKTVIVTGANSGIGKETALDLASRGAKVILACRDLHRADEARDDIVSATGSKSVLIRQLDLASLTSVRKFAENILESQDRLDVLVNNAGTGGEPFRFTEDDLEVGMQINYFGPFLLTCLLLDLLKKTPFSRIVVVSSRVYDHAGSFDVDNMNCEKKPIGGFLTYCNSKLCNILMTQYLAEKLTGKGVSVNCLHPGLVHTNLLRNVPNTWLRVTLELGMKLLCKTARDGAQTVIHLAVSDEGMTVSGKYFVDLKETDVEIPVQVPGLAKKVWERSEVYVRLTENERLRLFQ